MNDFMDGTWKVIKTVAGSFVIVYGIHFALSLAKNKGKQEAFDEFEKKKAYVEVTKNGDPAIFEINGKKFKMKYERVD